MGLVTQQDPIGIAGGLNLYGYANGDPVNLSDPSGLCPLCIAGLEWLGETFGARAATWIMGRALPFVVEAAGVAVGMSLPAGEPGVDDLLVGASYAQRTFGEAFSSAGTFAGRTVDDVAHALKAGEMAVEDVPIDYIVRDGSTLILNTRSAQALERAGVPRTSWKGVDRTGQDFYESLVSQQLERNGLTSLGTRTVTSSGK